MQIFSDIERPQVGRSVFDLSYTKLFTCDMGQLIPVQVDEVVPGDRISIGHDIVIRMQPLVAPILHEVDVYTHTFFVPYRLLKTDTFDFEEFITGGLSGDDASVLPVWNPANAPETAVGSLWDYLGFPVGVDPVGAYPLLFPKMAYYMIWNEFYRDQNLQTELDITSASNYQIMQRNWQKDYFTSALLSMQRGTVPKLPLTGILPVVFNDGTNSGSLKTNTHSGVTSVAGVDGSPSFVADGTVAGVDLGTSNAVTVSDLRLIEALQVFMEINNLSGVRYTEFLKAHFGKSPTDARLDRPEYIGGTKSPVIVSEVLQTSETGTSPQGNMSGHGITVARQFAGKYEVEEYGLIMTLMSVMPKPMYSQGINKQWLHKTQEDFYFPVYAHLSEQAVIGAEIFASGDTTDNNSVFGYQPRYDHMRYKPNMVCGQMRTTFNYWHMGREFSSLPGLNEDFIKCVPRKDIFAVPSEPGLIVSVGNNIKAVRPLPVMGTPGQIRS